MKVTQFTCITLLLCTQVLAVKIRMKDDTDEMSLEELADYAEAESAAVMEASEEKGEVTLD